MTKQSNSGGMNFFKGLGNGLRISLVLWMLIFGITIYADDIVQSQKVPAGSWIAVYYLGGAANSDGSVTIQGYDVAQ